MAFHVKRSLLMLITVSYQAGTSDSPAILMRDNYELNRVLLFLYRVLYVRILAQSLCVNVNRQLLNFGARNIMLQPNNFLQFDFQFSDLYRTPH